MRSRSPYFEGGTLDVFCYQLLWKFWTISKDPVQCPMTYTVAIGLFGIFARPICQTAVVLVTATSGCSADKVYPRRNFGRRLIRNYARTARWEYPNVTWRISSYLFTDAYRQISTEPKPVPLVISSTLMCGLLIFVCWTPINLRVYKVICDCCLY